MTTVPPTRNTVNPTVPIWEILTIPPPDSWTWTDCAASDGPLETLADVWEAPFWHVTTGKKPVTWREHGITYSFRQSLSPDAGGVHLARYGGHITSKGMPVQVLPWRSWQECETVIADTQELRQKRCRPSLSLAGDGECPHQGALCLLDGDYKPDNDTNGIGLLYLRHVRDALASLGCPIHLSASETGFHAMCGIDPLEGRIQAPLLWGQRLRAFPLIGRGEGSRYLHGARVEIFAPGDKRLLAVRRDHPYANCHQDAPLPTIPWRMLMDVLQEAVPVEALRPAIHLLRCPGKGEYGFWLSRLIWLKSLDFNMEEVEAWSASGPNHSPGAVAERWQGLPPDRRVEALRKFLAELRKGATPTRAPQRQREGQGKVQKGESDRSGSQADPRDGTRETLNEALETFARERLANGDIIHWMGSFYMRHHGQWQIQSDAYIQKMIRTVAAGALGKTGAAVAVSKTTITNYSNLLADVLAPACVDTRLLAEKDRLRAFHLDTGALLQGVPFSNGVLQPLEDGSFRLEPRNPRHLYSTSRPYAFPENHPPRPRLFDAWLEERLPVAETRQAFWEALGATVSQHLHREQKLVALLGAGRSGKGTAAKVARFLVGDSATVVFTGGPSRMASSQFALAKLSQAALVSLPDMPLPPKSQGYTRDGYMQGLSIVKSLVGGDQITIEAKFKNPISAVVEAGVWVDSNFGLGEWVLSQDDSYAWNSRLLPLPFDLSLSEEEQEPEYEKRFLPEIPCIAWHAVAAYSAARQNGGFTWSNEMRMLQVELTKGKVGAADAVLNRCLVREPGAWTTRQEVFALLEQATGVPPDNGLLGIAYTRCLALRDVRSGARGGVRGFHNLAIRHPQE